MPIQNTAPKHIRAIAPYQAGKPIDELAREFGLDENTIVKLASNENPLGMSPKAKEAMLAAVGELARYPDANGFELKTALSQRYGVPTNWVTLGNGSNDILELVAHAFLSSGASCVYSEHAFVVYSLATQATGAKSIVVPATNLGHDLLAMRGAIMQDTRLVFLANPNNPTGTFLSGSDIQAFIASVPNDVVVVLDEAYNEYLRPEQRYDAIEFVRCYPNVLVSRSFSKAYGLAGLRVGYGIAQPELTDLLNRIRQPFNVNSLAQAAAVASLFDEAFLAKTYELNQAGLKQLETAFERLGLSYIPSSGNFVLVKIAEDDTAGSKVNLELLKRGVIVRPVNNYGLPQWLRISVGSEKENQIFIDALPQAMLAAGFVGRVA